MKKILYLIIPLLFLAINAQQKIDIKADTTTIRIGEPITFSIIAQTSKNTPIKILSPQDSLGTHLEILNKKDTIISINHTKKYLQKIQVSSYEPGEFLINPIKIILGKDTLYTQTLKITVIDVPIDEKKQPMYDIKDIQGTTKTWKDYILDSLPYVLIIIALLVTILLIIWYIKKKNHKKNNQGKQKVLKIHEKAIEELDLLGRKDYLDSKKSKKYYTEMIEILRNYITARYNIPANKLLSSDLFNVLNQKNIINHVENTWLKNIIVAAEFAKFAKSTPTKEQSIEHLEEAKKFVESTKETVIEEFNNNEKLRENV